MSTMTQQVEEDFFRGEPSSILGLIKIKEKDYALVKWTTGSRQFYVPYEFMKTNYPSLLLEFYSSIVHFKLITPRRKLKDLIKEHKLE